MAHDHPPVEIDPAQIQRAEAGWHIFTQYGKFLVAAVFIILAAMAIFLI